MKTTYLVFAVSLLALFGCSTAHTGHHGSTKADPETVLITYHVRPGKEAELQTVLLRAWEVYRREHLVLAEPHVVTRDREDGGKPGFIEIFTWVSHAAPDHAPDAVKKLWEQEQSLCEARGGRTAIEGGEVELLIPAHE
jgi:hypothetical protein